MDDLERISVGVAHRNEAPVNGYWIRLPLLYPEERLLAVTKSPQIGMTAFALVRHEKYDVKRLQGRLIERQRTLDIADSQNNVVQHRFPPKHECGRRDVGKCPRAAMGPSRYDTGRRPRQLPVR